MEWRRFAADLREICRNQQEKPLRSGSRNCSGNPFCANGALAETEAGSDVANSLKRLPLFSYLSSDDLTQLDRFVLAENEDSGKAIYQAMPDYVKLTVNGKEAIEALGVGAAIGGKSLATLGVVGKASNQSYQPNPGAVGNMTGFFKQSGFGSLARENSHKTSQVAQGQRVYQAKNIVGEHISKGDKC